MQKNDEKKNQLFYISGIYGCDNLLFWNLFLGICE